MSSVTPNFKRTKFACYAAYFTMSSIFSLPPLLFVIFRETYGISYTNAIQKGETKVRGFRGLRVR